MRMLRTFLLLLHVCTCSRCRARKNWVEEQKGLKMSKKRTRELQEELEELLAQVKEKDQLIDTAAKDDQIKTLQRKIIQTLKEGLLQRERKRQRKEMDSQLMEELQSKEAEMSRLREELRTYQEQEAKQHYYQEQHQADMEEMTRELERESERNRELQGELKELLAQVEEKKSLIATKDRDIAAKDGQVQELQRVIEAKNGLLQIEKEAMEEMREEYLQIKQQLQSIDAKMSRLGEKLGCEEQEGPSQVPPSLPLQLQWRHGPDMPFEMSRHIQSVLVQGKVYVGGGRGSENYIVMEYDTCSGKWAKLPPYGTRDFAMTVISDQLVLVGGLKHGNWCRSKVLGVWSDDSKEWMHPYPDMPTAREECSAVVFNEWLVVSGGCDGNRYLSCVEVMNTDIKQWYTGPPTPVPWHAMKTAVVGDMCYFLGGYTGSGGLCTVVYSLSLPALISQLQSRHRHEQIWKEISGLDILYSTPLSMSGSLHALGGRKSNKAVTDIHLYQPDTGEWVKVGDLPSPRYNCTSVMIDNSGELLVAGGYDQGRLSGVDMATLPSPQK